MSETLSSLALQVLSLALPAAARQLHRTASQGSLFFFFFFILACPGTWGSSSPVNSSRALSAAAPTSGSVNPLDESAPQPRRAVNREVGGTPANSKLNYRNNSSWSQTQQPTRKPGSRLKYVNFFFFFFFLRGQAGKQSLPKSMGRKLRDTGREGPEFPALGPRRARLPLQLPRLGSSWV